MGSNAFTGTISIFCLGNGAVVLILLYEICNCLAENCSFHDAADVTLIPNINTKISNQTTFAITASTRS